MTAPGELNRRLVLQEPVETADGAGGVTRSYTRAMTLWASVEPVSARNAVVADAPGATVTHRIVIRRRAAVTTRHRFAEGTTVYRIVTLRDDAPLPRDRRGSTRGLARREPMSTAAVALRAAIHDALVADGALVALLGGPKIYDEPPKAAAFPYVTLGDARIEDFSAGNDPAQEHRLTLHAWSRQGGHKEAHMIAGALLQALDDAPLAPNGHHLVNLRFSVADIRREADGRTYHALLRFRAVTEPA